MTSLSPDLDGSLHRDPSVKSTILRPSSTVAHGKG